MQGGGGGGASKNFRGCYPSPLSHLDILNGHQKKSELKNPKIDPIFGIFPEASEFSFK